MTVKSVKLSNAQVLALRSVQHNADGRAYVTEGKTQTLNSLRRMGILFGDGSTLTRQGLSASQACDNPSMRNGKLYAVVNLSETYTATQEYIAEVSEVPMADWEREIMENGTVAPSPRLLGVMMHDGTYRGLCSAGSVSDYSKTIYSGTADAEAMCANCGRTMESCADASESMASSPSYVGVRQSRPGWQGVEHIHAEGCRDIAREMRRFGQAETDTFTYVPGTTVADLIASNWADVASDTYGNNVMGSADAWRDMVEWSTDDTSGLKIMACAKDMAEDECVAGTVSRSSQGWVMITPRTGVTDCSECGEHIMSDDLSIPAQCEDGCDMGEADMSAVADLIPANGTVYSAIISSHAPNGTAWTTDMRTMTEWTPFPGNDLDAIGQVKLMVTNNARDAVGWLLPDGTAVVAVTIRGEIGTAYMITPDTCTDEPMADTMSQPMIVEAKLMITVSEGVTIDLGWHYFEIMPGDERSIPTLYGQQHGEWKNGEANWDSIITVTDSYIAE